MKRILCLIFAIWIVFLFALSAYGETIDLLDNWVVETIDDGASYRITSGLSDADTLWIPSAIDGLPVTEIGDSVFSNSTALHSVIMYEPLSVIGDYAFCDCTELESVWLPVSLTELGEGAFSGTVGLTQIHPENTALTGISDYAFSYSGLQEIVLSETCTFIGDGAFRNCTALTTVTIPDSVAEIGDDAFSGCDALTIVCRPGSFAAQYAQEIGIDVQFALNYGEYVRGDADHDLMVTIMDATRIQRYLAEIEFYDAAGVHLRGDVNGDGLNVMDATAIQRFLSDLGNPYEIGEIVKD